MVKVYISEHACGYVHGNFLHTNTMNKLAINEGWCLTGRY